MKVEQKTGWTLRISGKPTHDGQMRVTLGLSLALFSSLAMVRPLYADQFRQELDRINERYEDFFAHQEREQRHQKSIQKGVPELHELRRREASAADEARLKYRSKRHERPDTPELEAEYLRMRDRERAAFEKQREEHIEIRSRLRSIQEGARKIPEAREAGLDE